MRMIATFNAWPVTGNSPNDLILKKIDLKRDAAPV
jgi:hypothetical protein